MTPGETKGLSDKDMGLSDKDKAMTGGDEGEATSDSKASKAKFQELVKGNNQNDLMKGDRSAEHGRQDVEDAAIAATEARKEAAKKIPHPEHTNPVFKEGEKSDSREEELGSTEEGLSITS